MLSIIFVLRVLNAGFCLIKDKRKAHTIYITINTAIFLITLTLPIFVTFGYQQSFSIALNRQALIFTLIFDRLTWVMGTFIAFVGLIISRFTITYLYSDLNQARFMQQLSLLILSVTLFIFSGNLLTAFVGWQWIGLSLYLLLNHFHYRESANKAAKKKFIINRLGDMCFLIAVLLSIKYYGQLDFAQLNQSLSQQPQGLLILTLLLLAVIPKSAQFPLHIWLIDTMEAPTPVSAVMHAGIINAGGFLIIRLSQAYTSYPVLMNSMLILGLLSALYGGFYALNQGDVKRRLAFSTMGQMGYMIFQCGLGCFVSALLHLIFHGFYKASLFLGSQGTLNQKNINSEILTENSYKHLTIATLTTAISLLIGYGLFQPYFFVMTPLPIIIFFIAFFIIFNLNSIKKRKSNIEYFILAITVLGGYITYLYILKRMILFTKDVVIEHLSYEMNYFISLILLALVLFGLFFNKFLFIKSKLFNLSINTYLIEDFYRKYLLIPLRQLGDLFNTNLISNLLLIIIPVFISATLFLSNSKTITCFFTNYFFPFYLLMLMTACNRARRFREIVLYFLTSSYILILILIYKQEIKDAVFYGINAGFLIISFIYLSYLKRLNHNSQTLMKELKYQQYVVRKNRLTVENLYIAFLLMLFLGVPGSAVFVTEYKLMNLYLGSVFNLFVFGVYFIFVAIVIMHVLQEYAFSETNKAVFKLKLSLLHHLLFLLTIVFNLVNGFLPNYLYSLIGVFK